VPTSLPIFRGRDVRRLLASRRRRRRLTWLTAAAVVAGLLVTAVFHYSDNGGKGLTKERPGPPTTAPTPKTVSFRPSQHDVATVVSGFVQDAVLRRHVEKSFDLVAPQLRQGLSRAQWATGEIPVVPYPANDLASARWRLQYSYANRVGLVVGMFPKPRAKTPYEVFSIELIAYRSQGHRRWLVDSWAPAGLGIGQPGSAPTLADLPPSKAQLDGMWILAPIALLGGLIVLIPGGLFLRGYLRNRRVSRRLHATGPG